MIHTKPYPSLHPCTFSQYDKALYHPFLVLFFGMGSLHHLFWHTVDREIFVVKNISSVCPTTTKIGRTKIFQRRSDKMRIALLGYMKPVHGLPAHRRLFLTRDKQHMSTFSSVCRLHISAIVT